MRLVELNPRWAVAQNRILVAPAPERHGMGVSFDCPHCRAVRISVFFGNPVDGLHPSDAIEHLWQRAGDTFDVMTLTPSIDCSKWGHWHGSITDGAIV